MPAAQQDHIALRYQFRRILHIARVQKGDVPRLHAVIGKAAGKGIRHLIVEFPGLGIRGDHQQISAGLHAAAQIFHKTVALAEYTGQLHAIRHLVLAGAAGQKHNHSVHLIFVFAPIITQI